MTIVTQVLTPAITLGDFNKLQALSGVGDAVRVPLRVASHDFEEISVVNLLLLIHKHMEWYVDDIGYSPECPTLHEYARLVAYLEGLL